jgi:hypothetical protein
VKKELAEGKVPTVPKAEQHEPKNVQTFGKSSFGKGFQVFWGRGGRLEIVE